MLNNKKLDLETEIMLKRLAEESVLVRSCEEGEAEKINAIFVEIPKNDETKTIISNFAKADISPIEIELLEDKYWVTWIPNEEVIISCELDCQIIINQIFEYINTLGLKNGLYDYKAYIDKSEITDKDNLSISKLIFPPIFNKENFGNGDSISVSYTDEGDYDLIMQINNEL